MTVCTVLGCVWLFATHWTLDYSPQGSFVHGIFPNKNTGGGCHASSRGSSHPGIKHKTPTLQADSLPSDPSGKLKYFHIYIYLYNTHTHTHTHTHTYIACVKGLCCVKSLQLCPTPCDPMDCSPPCSSVHRILQVRILEWLAMPFSREPPQSWDQTCISYVSCIGRLVLYH